MTEPLWREAVGRELRSARREKNRTLADVAERANVSVPYLSEVERGRKEPSSEVLGSVCRALDLRLMDLTARVSRSLLAETAVTARPVPQRMTRSASRPATLPASRPRGELCLAA